MLGQILLNRFKFLTLTEYESSSGSTFFKAVSIYGGGLYVSFYRCYGSSDYIFKFPQIFSIKLIDFNDENEIKLLDAVKNSFDNKQDKLTDIEIQNIFKYFEYVEKINDDKCKEYCERHNIPLTRIENTDIPVVEEVKTTDTPFVEEVQINW